MIINVPTMNNSIIASRIFPFPNKAGKNAEPSTNMERSDNISEIFLICPSVGSSL